MRLSLAIVLALAPSLTAQEPPAGFGTPDHQVDIGVLPARLRFDKERFVVAPGSKVQLTLTNNDSMMHNLLICKPGDGVTQRIGNLALQLGAQAMEKQFVPESDEILHHTRAILPGEKDTLWFTAPKQAGEYPYVCTLPGHMYTMVGIMQVGGKAPAKGPLSAASYRVFDGSWEKLPDFGALEPTAEGELDGPFDLAIAEKNGNYGIRFEGTLTVAKPGRYTFFLSSDDGSRLSVDDATVVEWDGIHPAGKDKKGNVDLTAGAHRVRLDFFQGGGGQVLRAAFRGPGVKRTSLTSTPKQNRAPAGIPIAVHHHARAMRVHVENAAPRTIAVGLPGGTNYAFDAETCAVQFGWSGAFLDVGPDRQGRGGQPCKTLGPRFSLGPAQFPLRSATGGTRPIAFRGYRLEMGNPRFLLNWGGRKISWWVTAPTDRVGLTYHFELEQSEGTIFRFDPAAVTCTTTDGAISDDSVVILNKRTFSVTLAPKGALK